MAEHPPPRRRSSIAMYDPARDVFTQSDEMVPVTVSDDHSVNQEADAPRESEQACLTTGSQQVHVPTPFSPTARPKSPPQRALQSSVPSDMTQQSAGRESSNMVSETSRKRHRDPEDAQGPRVLNASPSPNPIDSTLPSTKKRRSTRSPDGESQETKLAQALLPSDQDSRLSVGASAPLKNIGGKSIDSREQSKVSEVRSQESGAKQRQDHGSRHLSKSSNQELREPQGIEDLKAKTVGNLPSFRRKNREDRGDVSRRDRNQYSAYDRRDQPRQRSRSPLDRRRVDRYTPPPRRSHSPGDRRRSRSPRRQSPGKRHREYQLRRSRSPSPIRRSLPAEQVRQRKRPGRGARVDAGNVQAWRQREEERERQQEREAQHTVQERGVQAISNQFYNSRPDWVKEKGRGWRTTGSQIKGIRSFNNWVKSTLIQKFSPGDAPSSGAEEGGWADAGNSIVDAQKAPLLVLDMGCGKGGDLGKWDKAPDRVGLYVGLDPAAESIQQANSRYAEMNGRRRTFEAHILVQDCFGDWIGNVPIIQQVGIDPDVGPGASMMSSRWGGGGGFDIVTMMFSMHYSFQNEAAARMMLRNAAGALKKGGRFIGVGPSSDALSEKVAAWHRQRKEKEEAAKAPGNNLGKQNGHDGIEDKEGHAAGSANTNELSWGNSIYKVVFSDWHATPEDGIFRPAYGHPYHFFLEEAVDVPEFVVPWEAFRAIAEEYNLEQRYRKNFTEVWDADKDDPVLGPLSIRMGVRRDAGSPMNLSDEEREVISFYHAWCFTKV